MWWITPFTPLQSAGMALVIALTGFLGGLALSAVKRSLGAKDWGAMIEGHGGVMDRMDSVSFAAPICFHMTRHCFPQPKRAARSTGERPPPTGGALKRRIFPQRSLNWTRD
jgi:hypothetical protein